MRCRAVLFDLDGTLVDTVELWIGCYLATLADFGVDLPRDRFLETIYSRNRPLPQVLADHGIADAPAFRSRRDERYLEALLGAEWLPGARDLLARARVGRPLGIVTAAWRSYVDVLDARHGIRTEVDVVIDADDTRGRAKPNPHGLLLAASRLGVEPGECWYVGDQAFDVDAARAAGMTSCLVRTPHLHGAPRADVEVDALADLSFPDA